MRLFALLSTLIFVALDSLMGQGELLPPGPPAPMMKSLDQIEPRLIVNATNTPGDEANTFIISAPGSYYFTANVTGEPGKHGISIQSNDVTLDLNGFALIAGGGGAFRGVDIPAAQTGFTLRNGTIRGWTDGGLRTEPAIGTTVEKVRAIANTGAIGLGLANGIARDCVATGNGTGFFLGNGAAVHNSSASGNEIGFFGSDRSHMGGCIATSNTNYGFRGHSFVSIVDCTSSRNVGTGIVAGLSSQILRCNASRNDFGGISTGAGCTVADCTVGSTTSTVGIFVDTGSTVRGCTTRANATTGIFASVNCHITGNTSDANINGIAVSGAGNRIDGNSCSNNSSAGFNVSSTGNLVIRNSARANGTNFSIGSNASGPIVDMSGGGLIPNNSPWANFSY